MDKTINLLVESNFQGEYDSTTNTVLLHVDHHYFTDPLSKEDIEDMIEQLRLLQSLFKG